MNRLIVVISAVGAMLVFLVAPVVDADMIALYDLGGSAGELGSLAAGTADANVAAGNLVVSANIGSDWFFAGTWPGMPNYPGWYGVGNTYGPYGNQAEAAYLASNYYLSLTVTADAGYELNLTQLSFDEAASGPSTDDWYLFTDVNGFTVGNSVDTADFVGSQGSLTYNTPIVDLSGAAYQGLSGIELRIYFGNSSSGAKFFDNVELTGTVDETNGAEIPEPGTLLLLGTGALTLLGYMRRRSMT